MKPPRIRPADGRNSEFHDSGLIEFRVSPTFDWMVIVVSTPDEGGGENQWQIKFTGLLRLEFETSGNGAGETFPGEIYDIYEFADSDERSRWVKRLSVLEDLQVQNDHVHHIVLASSLVRGWGDRGDLDGVHIICRGYEISGVSS